MQNALIRARFAIPAEYPAISHADRACEVKPFPIQEFGGSKQADIPSDNEHSSSSDNLGDRSLKRSNACAIAAPYILQ